MPTSRNQVACNITLSKEIHAYLTEEANRLGISRSALISTLLAQDKAKNEALLQMANAKDLVAQISQIQQSLADGQMLLR